MLELHRRVSDAAEAESRRVADLDTDESDAAEMPARERDEPPPSPAPARARRDASPLTARQLQVLALVSEGQRYAEIACALNITAQQVGRHLREARKRVGCRTTAELVAWARREGLLP